MKLIIFDMDGTLVDTETMYIQVLVQFLRSHNQKVDMKMLQDTVGISFDEFYQRLSNHWNPKKSKEEIQSLFEQINWRTTFDWNDLLFPFVHYCLTTLKENGYTLVIASGSPMELIKDMVESTKTSSYFDKLYTADDCTNGKPDPEIFLKIMLDYQIEAKDVIVIEDSIHGIDAGKAAGAYVIARKEDRLPFCQQKADYIATDFSDITNHILERG